MHSKSKRLEKLFFLPALGVFLSLAGCSSTDTPLRKDSADSIPPAFLSIIPEPYSIERTPGFFSVGENTKLSVRPANTEVLDIARWFSELMQRTRGLHLDLRPLAGTDANDGIVLVLDPKLAIKNGESEEAYELTVTPRRVTVAARTAHGLFNGTTTLWQLLTLDNSSALPAKIPCLRIDDHPRFVWRGLMLDPARHFQSPEFVKQFIDAMALHKFNILHWHLTDDQGWRIEIKQYPKLTQIGAWRRPAGAAGTDANGQPVRYGGYYTQEQIRDIVAYARQRYVTIVPEIEMPGHAQAAIAAYPELGVSGRNPGVSYDWGVHTYLYNVDESTFTFLENVLDEVMRLFPSPYIHIGGDEAAKDQWQASARVQARMRELGIKNETALQGWFTHRIERFLAAHGRKLIGWDEILEGGIPPQATVMSWRGSKGAIDAARQGHDVVLAPDPDLYFDHLPGDLPDEPAGRVKVISLHDVYDFNPIPKELSAEEARHVLGAQADLWSEYLPTDASIERAAYPRAAALAEVLWSPPQAHDWHGFLDRLVAQQARYSKLGIGYSQSAFAVHIDTDYDAKQKSVAIKLSDQADFGSIHYTLDGSMPDLRSPQYRAPFDTPAQGEIRATAFAQGQALADPQTRKLDPSALLRRYSSELASCHPDRGVLLRLPDDAPANRHRKVYQVEIFDPCWLWPRADLDGVARISVRVARLPYNFQLWKDIKSVVDRKPLEYKSGELQIRIDGCNSAPAAIVPLPAVFPPGEKEVSLVTELAPPGGRHDLCLQFATGGHDPLWVIDWVQLATRP